MSDGSVEKEVWVPVAGIPWGFYEVSNLGRVKSVSRLIVRKDGRSLLVKEWILTPGISRGHSLVTLNFTDRRSSRWVHRLIMDSFVGPRPIGQDIRHLDGNPINNRLDNLRYGTRAENCADTMRHDRAIYGERSSFSKLKESYIHAIIQSSSSDRILADQYGVARKTIWAVRARRSWKHVRRPETTLELSP